MYKCVNGKVVPVLN